MTVLALDLGQDIGYFLGDAVGPCRWGAAPLKKTTDLGMWLKSSDEFFQQILPMCSAIAVEQPFFGSSYWPARKLLALLGHLYYHANYVGIGAGSIKEIPVATGKLTLAGSGRADKDAMIRAAAADGYEGMCEHSADAYGLWKVYVFGKRDPIPKPRTTTSRGKSILNAQAQNDGETP
jgi:hypothetical protein